MEAVWRGSLLGLVIRSGGLGGLITPAEDIFLPTEPGESAGDVNKSRASSENSNSFQSTLWVFSSGSSVLFY